MKRTASPKRNSSASGTSTRRKAAPRSTFAVCVCNDGYEASLERDKIYAVLPDDEAERDGDLRVVDESGEDCLFCRGSLRRDRSPDRRQSLAPEGIARLNRSAIS